MIHSHGLGRNPILPPDICIPDGEAHVFGDRLYVYGSRDLLSDCYCSDEYAVVSTSDMLHWDVSDKSLDGKAIPWTDAAKRKGYPAADFDVREPAPFFRGMLRDVQFSAEQDADCVINGMLDFGKYIEKKQLVDEHLLYAPDCMEKDGNYYLYFCMSDYSEGVAVSDSPNGPFREPQQLPCAGIDPAVFTDDDGKSYYYWGQFRSCGVPLNDDMVSFDETKIVYQLLTEEEHGFHEGSSMRKRNGIYYYVYPCIFRKGRPTCLAYATSDSPLGPFTYRGILIDNAKCDPESWNIHGSIECFHGQWYVFYHRSSKNSRINRRMCVEKIFFREDGTIGEVKMTSIGAGQPFALGETIPAWRACEVDGGAFIDGETLVMPNGSSAVFRYVKWEDVPVQTLTCEEGEGHLEILADEMPLQGAEVGIHEIKIICHGDLKVISICFQSAD